MFHQINKQHENSRNMGKKDIEKHQFKKGKSGNTNGRPRKSFSSINKELKDSGVEPLTKSALIEAYELVFNSSEEVLKKIAEDKETPYGLKLIIKELNNAKTRSKALADYRDYMFGRAKESKDITTNGNEIDTTINFIGLDN